MMKTSLKHMAIFSLYKILLQQFQFFQSKPTNIQIDYKCFNWNGWKQCQKSPTDTKITLLNVFQNFSEEVFLQLLYFCSLFLYTGKITKNFPLKKKS